MILAAAAEPTERDQLLAALRAELLGPRDGPWEILPLTQDPRDEYVTGVLAPQRMAREIEADDTLALLAPELNDGQTEGPELDEEESEESEAIPAVEFASPSIDPRALPTSMGLSFVLSPPDEARFRVLCTYARYSRAEDSWKRSPESFLSESLKAGDHPPLEIAPSVELRIETRLVDEGRRVTLRLFNAAGPTDRMVTEDLIFQPQLRVILEPGTALVAMSIPVSEDDGVEKGLQWRERLSFARGHLCSAVWHDVDPERPDSRNEAYAWKDGEALEPAQRSMFMRPDVRTEYLPSYEIRNPEMGWSSGLPAPKLSASVLAESFDASSLQEALSPLIEGFNEWISLQARISSQAPPEIRQADDRNLEQCIEASSRLAAALDLLVVDEDARLAFCFANRAIALQASWQGFNLEWRPFQLAFILLNLPAIVDPAHADRDSCDLLYFPTGGGKTEAYLALMAFTIAHRRRRGSRMSDEHAAAGTAVISRYTLRLLTIQQFRRTARLIMACEYLRVVPNRLGGSGWLPRNGVVEDAVWGSARISLGLWVGGGVTPNNLLGVTARAPNGRVYRFLGANDILRGSRFGAGVEIVGSDSEPAQLLTCPACGGMLAVPEPSLQPGTHHLHFPIYLATPAGPPAAVSLTAAGNLTVTESALWLPPGASPNQRILSLTIEVGDDQTIRAQDLDEWFASVVAPHLPANSRLECARPSRMGYLIRSHPVPTGSESDYDFAIYCPAPDCPLAVSWYEQVPIAEDPIRSGSAGQYASIPPMFQRDGDPYTSVRMPITAYTVDEQVYSRLPTVVIATVDKFARLSDEPRAATIFGNADYYHARWGYYRQGAPHLVGLPNSYQEHPRDPRQRSNLRRPVHPLLPPSLIIQDELHLIDGPLGSMVGAYEVIIDELCRQPNVADSKVKYIASTATVSRAGDQILSIFNRKLRVFPPPAPTANENFFYKVHEGQPQDGANGRLYVGISPVGRGAQTPLIRTWAALLSTVGQQRASGVSEAICDPYWTLVGYFNAIRELAAGRALFRQDIPQRLGQTRELNQDALELSGRTSSLELPRILDELERALPNQQVVDALVTTSMFGTGIDVSRLGLMVVHGQPKTTSAYIQATGRVGRQSPALVPVILRPSRPRDLDHYEFFVGFHRAIGRWVEPVTVAPFAPRTCEKILGPIQVALLRQCRTLAGTDVPSEWRVEQRLSGGRYYSSAHLMSNLRTTGLMRTMGELLEKRAQAQPINRRPSPNYVLDTASNELDRWRMLAQLENSPNGLLYRERAALRVPDRSVVLGDPQHRHLHLPQAFRDAPDSLRDVEGTFGVYVP